MSTLTYAFLLFAALVLAVVVIGGGLSPLPVILSIGTTTLTTSAPVALIAAVAILLLAFYMGRFVTWLRYAAHRWLRRRETSTEETLLAAHAALALNDTPAALTQAFSVIARTPLHQELQHLVLLHQNPLPKLDDTLLHHPRLAAPTALAYARAAAAEGDWPTVSRLTAIARQSAPTHPALLTLQFKALVNLNDPAATSLLPALKPLLGTAHHKLLTQVLQGPTSVTARPVLDAPWVKAFQQWLPTGSDTFPA